ncbi:MAG: hypothetical protein LBT56_03090 [Prevotellaceae bacterium]|nr:hypothetical protein [Prevotellaceae bacterium]
MIKKIIYIILLIPVFAMGQSDNTNIAINLSSVDSFFELSHKISLGQVPTAQEWQLLFETKGYKISFGNSTIRREIIREMMIIAFSPNLPDSLKHKRDNILSISVEENLSDMSLLLSHLILKNYLDYGKNEIFLKKQRETYNFLAYIETITNINH